MNPPAPLEGVPPPLRMVTCASMSFVALVGVPYMPTGPELFDVPLCRAMGTPPGKFVIVLLLSSARVTLATLDATPPTNSWMPEPNEFPPAPVVVPLVSVLLEMFTSSSVPANCRIDTPCQRALVSVLPVIVTVPVTLASVADPVGSLKAMLDSWLPPPVPELLIVPFVNEKPLTAVVPRTPLPDVF